MCNPLSVLGVPSGPSSSEQGLSAQEASLSSSLLANYKEEYGAQQDTLKQLTSEISQIRSGNTGPGFGATENAALRSDIINQGAASARNTEQAVANAGAGQNFGGGDAGRVSAVRQAINAGVEGRASADTSNALLRENQANYATGRQNAMQTVGGLESLAGFQDPKQYASLASNTGQAAFGDAGKIRELQDAHEGGIGALIGSGLKLATGFATGGLSMLGSGESFGEGAKDFFKGGVDSLMNG